MTKILSVGAIIGALLIAACSSETGCLTSQEQAFIKEVEGRIETYLAEREAAEIVMEKLLTENDTSFEGNWQVDMLNLLEDLERESERLLDLPRLNFKMPPERERELRIWRGGVRAAAAQFQAGARMMTDGVWHIDGATFDRGILAFDEGGRLLAQANIRRTAAIATWCG